MLKRKVSQLLAAVMIATTVFSGNIVKVGATELSNVSSITAVENKVIANGEYQVNNTTEYIEAGNETGESMARQALKDKTVINVEDEKITMTLKFNESLYGFMENIKVSLDGQDLQGVNNSENKSITFEVPSVDAKVKVDMNISIMGREVSFYVTNDTSDLPLVEEESPSIQLEDGKYKATNYTYKTGTETESKSREYVEDKTIIDVKDGKVKMSIKYTEKGIQYITDTKAKVQGENINVIKSEDGLVTFEVPSVDSKVTVEISVTVPEMNFSHAVTFDLVNDINTLEKIVDDGSGDNGNNGDNGSNGDNKPSEPSEPSEPGKPNEPSNPDNDSSNNGSNDVVQGTKTYTVKNEVSHENSTGEAMARNYLNSISKFEEVNGKYYVTLTFKGKDLMQNHEIYVNGNKVDTTKTVNGDETQVRFEVKSIDDTLKVSVYVVPMGKEVEFGVKLLKDTLTLVDGSNNNGDSGNNGGNSGSNGGNSGSNGGSNNSGNANGTTSNDKVQSIVGKLYSIKNNVIHGSETGQSMARKYLNEISDVELIDGQYYITLTFTGAEFMQNHEIYVNGSKVSISRNVNGSETKIRFKVSSLADEIKVKVYVVPMSREVEFEVKLLEDTLTFIKEYKIDKLPETGAVAGSSIIYGLGLMLTSAGVVLSKKRSI